jgi:uncharacterized protein YxeA
MKKIILTIAVILLSSCCATNEFVDSEIADSNENYKKISEKTPIYIENETQECDKKIRDWTVRVNEHGRDHSEKFMARLSNFISRETQKMSDLTHCD